MENFQKIDFYKRREFGDKIGATISFIRQNAASFFKAQLFISGPAAILASVLYVLLFIDLFEGLEISAAGSYFASQQYFVSMFGVAICYLILYAAIYLVTFSFLRLYEESEDGKVTVREVYQLVISKLGIGILAILIMMAIVTMGTLLFVIPGIYLAVVCSLIFPVIVFEGVSPFTAISRSFTLISGKWWSTFGLIIVMGIIAYVLMMIVLVPVYIVGGFGVFAGLYGGEEVIARGGATGFMTGVVVLMSFMSYIGAIIAGSVIQIALGYQYGNLVEMKESRGLLSEIEQIGKEDKTGDSEGEY